MSKPSSDEKIRNDCSWAFFYEAFDNSAWRPSVLGGELGTPKLSSWYMVELVKEMIRPWIEFWRHAFFVFFLLFSKLRVAIGSGAS